MESPEPRLMWPAASLPRVFRAGRSTQADRGFAQVYRNSQLTIHLYAYAATVRIGEHIHRVQPGDLTLTPPDTAEGFDFTKTGLHWYIRLIPPAAAGGASLSLGLHHRLGHHAVEARRRCETVARDFRSAGGQTEHPSAWAAAAGAQGLLCWLAALDLPTPRGSAADACVDKAAALLRAPECATLSIAEVAQRSGMSQNRLARAFVERHGLTMNQFRTRNLIEVAKWMMESTDLPLATIRRRIAIEDPQRFNKLFRRMTGLSPRAWLAEHGPVTASAPLPRIDEMPATKRRR
jgi:AraC-like DNA-binding protein